MSAIPSSAPAVSLDNSQNPAAKGIIFCVECGDQPADVLCAQCDDVYCEVCFQALHRKGKRFLHETKNLDGTKFDCTQNVIKGSDNNKTVYANTGASAAATADAQANTSSSQSSAPISDATTNDQMQQDPQVKENKTDDNATTNTTHTANGTNATNATNATTDDAPMSTDDNNDNSNTEKQEYVLPADPPRNDWFEEDPTPEWFLRRSQTIPMRLTEAERQLLKVIEASLDVSEYTDKIDIYMYHNKAGRITEQLEEICRYICGLKICQDFRKGRAQMLGKEYKDNNEFLCDVFEIARRHKIRNPDKMRTTYGKLMYILMDAQQEEIKERTELQLVCKLRTVYRFLEERKGLNVLEDKFMAVATGELLTAGRTKEEIAKAKQEKVGAFRHICSTYQTALLSEDDIKLALGSIGDNHNFLRMNRDVVNQMIHYLKKYFHPDKADRRYQDLSIRYGRGGSCLNHDHRTHYFFVLQSLTLWRDILHDLFRLWCYAELDLVADDSYYRLRSTGQGLNRMQRCPRLSKAMSRIVSDCHKKMGSWVGLSVVHLGDRDVPNALVFIDKYNQVSRILAPIVQCISSLERLYADDAINSYLEDSFGDIDTLRNRILCDFFRHGFDGSGSDGGSCIDGRLTSAWNWCSKISKKKYQPVFLLSGFIGFDGSF